MDPHMAQVHLYNPKWRGMWNNTLQVGHEFLIFMYEILSFDSQENKTIDCKENLLVYPKSLVVLSPQLSNEKPTHRCNQLLSYSAC